MRFKCVALIGTLALGLLAVGLVGCAGSNEGQVSGTVRLDGEPLEKGTIRFEAVDGKAPTAGGPISAGQYSVRVPIGMSKVSISAPKVVGKKKIYPTPESPEMDVTVEKLLPKYNEKTELTFDVKAGANPKDWDLQSK